MYFRTRCQFMWVRFAHRFSFLCCAISLFCWNSSCVLCAHCWQCLWIAHSVFANVYLKYSYFHSDAITKTSMHILNLLIGLKLASTCCSFRNSICWSFTEKHQVLTCRLLILCKHFSQGNNIVSNFSAISWREQFNFQ